VLIITEKHLRSKALVGQQDESIDISNISEEVFDVGKLISIWQKLLVEKEKLEKAINKAKTGMEFNLDVAVDINKCRHNFFHS